MTFASAFNVDLQVMVRCQRGLFDWPDPILDEAWMNLNNEDAESEEFAYYYYYDDDERTAMVRFCDSWRVPDQTNWERCWFFSMYVSFPWITVTPDGRQTRKYISSHG